jgi:hypothetical protein
VLTVRLADGGASRTGEDDRDGSLLSDLLPGGGMSTRVTDVVARDDRVQTLSRAVAYAIVPFLMVAFAVLYPLPTDTARLFAWHTAS